MNKPSIIALATLSMVALLSCSRENGSSARSAATPVVVEVTPETQEQLMMRGKSIAAETFSILSSNLQSALASGGVTNALPYCSLAASPLTASVAERHGVLLRRVTHKPRNVKSRATELERAVLEQFQGALSSSNAPVPFVTNVQPGQVTFFAPIVLTNALCLKCHGQPGTDIPSEELAVIQRLYPADEAVGFKLGELRGAWRIDFPEDNIR